MKGSNLAVYAANSFIPIPELRTANGSLTIFFLHSPGVLYDEPRDDPIFPTDANRTLQVSNGSSTFFYHQPPLDQAQATVLACLDNHDFCIEGIGCVGMDPSLQPIRTEIATTPYQPLRKFPYARAALVFAYAALRQSGSYWAYFQSAERGLNVFPRALMGLWQFSLPPDQWRTEVQKLFNVSLAKMQMNIWYVAKGWKYDADLPQFNDFEIGEFRGSEICSRFRHQDPRPWVEES